MLISVIPEGEGGGGGGQQRCSFLLHFYKTEPRKLSREDVRVSGVGRVGPGLRVEGYHKNESSDSSSGSGLRVQDEDEDEDEG
jgi:hypothetical protein